MSSAYYSYVHPGFLAAPRQCCALAAYAERQCEHKAVALRWDRPVCRQHFTSTSIRFTPGGHWYTGGNFKVYVMTDDLFIKVGKSIRPDQRLHEVRPHAPRCVDRERLRVVATRYEDGRFTEGSAHRLLGYADRIDKEWWRLTERVAILLAMLGLTWPLIVEPVGS